MAKPGAELSVGTVMPPPTFAELPHHLSSTHLPLVGRSNRRSAKREGVRVRGVLEYALRSLL